MDLTTQQLAKYLALTRKRGAKTLSILGEKSKFIDAVNTEIGQQLLQDLVERHESLLKTIAETGGTTDQRAEYKVVKDLLEKWSDRIETYNRKMNEVTREING